MRALLASVALAIALCGSMVAVYSGVSTIDLYAATVQHPGLAELYRNHLVTTLVSGSVFIALIVWSVSLQKGAIFHVGQRQALFQTMAYSCMLLVMLPNVVTAMLLSHVSLPQVLLPVAFQTMVWLSYYYFLPAYIFGKDLFLTETVIQPLGIGGISVSAAFYAVVVLMTGFVVHFSARKLAARTQLHRTQASRPASER